MTPMYNAATGRNNSLTGGGGFTPYATGRKVYGSGRQGPNVGMTSNMSGYGQRDLRAKARKNALMQWAGRN